MTRVQFSGVPQINLNKVWHLLAEAWGSGIDVNGVFRFVFPFVLFSVVLEVVLVVLGVFF